MTEQDKLNAEVNKLLHEQIKLQNEAIHYAKKNKWFEFAIVLGVIGATVAVTKLFL